MNSYQQLQAKQAAGHLARPVSTSYRRPSIDQVYEGGDEVEEEETIVTTKTTRVVDAQGRTQSITTQTIKTLPDGSNIIETTTKNISRSNSRTNSLSSATANRHNSLLANSNPVNLTKIEEDLLNFEYNYLDHPEANKNLKLNVGDSAIVNKENQKLLASPFIQENHSPTSEHTVPEIRTNSINGNALAPVISNSSSPNKPLRSILKNSQKPILNEEGQIIPPEQLQEPGFTQPQSPPVAAHPYKDFTSSPRSLTQPPKISPPSPKIAISPAVAAAQKQYSPKSTDYSNELSKPKVVSPPSSIKFDDKVETIPIYNKKHAPVRHASQNSHASTRPSHSTQSSPQQKQSALTTNVDFYAAAMEAAYKRVYGDRVDANATNDPSAKLSDPPIANDKEELTKLIEKNSKLEKKNDEGLDDNYRYENHYKEFAGHSMREDIPKGSSRKERAKEEKRLQKEKEAAEKNARKEAEKSAKNEEKLARKQEKSSRKESKHVEAEVKSGKSPKSVFSIFGRKRKPSIEISAPIAAAVALESAVGVHTAETPVAAGREVGSNMETTDVDVGRAEESAGSKPLRFIPLSKPRMKSRNEPNDGPPEYEASSSSASVPVHQTSVPTENTSTPVQRPAKLESEPIPTENTPVRSSSSTAHQVSVPAVNSSAPVQRPAPFESMPNSVENATIEDMSPSAKEISNPIQNESVPIKEISVPSAIQATAVSKEVSPPLEDTQLPEPTVSTETSPEIVSVPFDKAPELPEVKNVIKDELVGKLETLDDIKAKLRRDMNIHSEGEIYGQTPGKPELQTIVTGSSNQDDISGIVSAYETQESVNPESNISASESIKPSSVIPVPKLSDIGTTNIEDDVTDEEIESARLNVSEIKSNTGTGSEFPTPHNTPIPIEPSEEPASTGEDLKQFLAQPVTESEQKLAEASNISQTIVPNNVENVAKETHSYSNPAIFHEYPSQMQQGTSSIGSGSYKEVFKGLESNGTLDNLTLPRREEEKQATIESNHETPPDDKSTIPTIGSQGSEQPTNSTVATENQNGNNHTNVIAPEIVNPTGTSDDLVVNKVEKKKQSKFKQKLYKYFINNYK